MNTSCFSDHFFSLFGALSIATSLIKMKNAFKAYAIKCLCNKTRACDYSWRSSLDRSMIHGKVESTGSLCNYFAVFYRCNQFWRFISLLSWLEFIDWR